jgi:ATP-dependent Lon protease
MYKGRPQRTREEYALSSEEGPTRGQKNEQGYLDKVLDKLQKKRRGEKSSDSTVDKAIEKAQELGLTDKLAQIQRELGEKRKSEDVPDQIRKLAELREAGAITDEEFEEKKKDLLERM